jgi:prephenate dehydratase
MPNTDNLIAFQGSHGAFSDMASRAVYPGRQTLPCASFEDAFAAVRDGLAGLAMIPIDNSTAGRVADIHHILPNAGLHIIGEHYQKIEMQLFAPEGATLAGIKTVHSHVHAISQCRKFLREHGLTASVHADTAGAAAEVAERGDLTQAAIASALAGEIYGLKPLARDVHDNAGNTTRFIIMAREPLDLQADRDGIVTSLVFRVRSVPAALYKAMGGFATNGVNMTKLESYIVDGTFMVAQFYAEIEGHPEERPVRLALEELDFFSREVKILGVYPASPFRRRPA